MNNSRIKKIGQEVIKLESVALSKLSKSLDKDFVKAVELISKQNGKVILSGVGKSGNIAGKIAASFTSTGIPAIYLTPVDASHGDMGIIEKSLSKTGKVVIVYEDNLTNGPGAEIAAKISDDFFELLDGPISRVAAKDSPVPFNWFLEEKILPQTEDIAESIKELMEY